MNALTISAPAKLNLLLRVGPRDSSGYHPLASWFCTVGLFDTLSIARADDGALHLECDDPAIPRDARNLVMKAAMRLLERADATAQGLRLELRKTIPSAAGLGGGSSDAAAALVAINRLLKLNRSVTELSAIAAGIGSDVPFFLHGPSAVCTGRGEVVTPTPPPMRARYALLVLPKIAMATADVYARFDQLDLGRAQNLSAFPDCRELSALPSVELLRRLANDLEPAAFAIAPALRELRDAIERELARPVRMSGSGSTLFTLFDSRDEAQASAGKANARFDSVTAAVQLATTFNLAPERSDA